MSGYVDHAWRHAPKRLGGTDPIPGTSPKFAIQLYSPFDVVEEDDTSLDSVFRFPATPDMNGMGLSYALAYVSTPSTSGIVQLQVHRFSPDPAGGGLGLFDDYLTIDQDDYTSLTSSAPWSLFGEILTTGDWLFIQVRQAGTGAMGLGVHLWFA